MTRTKFAIFFFIVALFAGCATFKPPWSLDLYHTVKTCKTTGLKLTFMVQGSNTNSADDIFIHELTIKANLKHEEYGKIQIWLYYPKMNASEIRTLPEYPPEKIVIQTEFGEKRGETENFLEIWKQFMTPDRLTFIENCVYGF